MAGNHRLSNAFPVQECELETHHAGISFGFTHCPRPWPWYLNDSIRGNVDSSGTFSICVRALPSDFARFDRRQEQQAFRVRKTIPVHHLRRLQYSSLDCNKKRSVEGKR
jgi:hypothetical protein